jgi:hypothetical protein
MAAQSRSSLAGGLAEQIIVYHSITRQRGIEQEPFMHVQFAAKVALVTGGNPGIGRAFLREDGRLI